MGGVGWPCSDLWDPDAVRECGCCHSEHAHREDVSTDLHNWNEDQWELNFMHHSHFGPRKSSWVGTS